MEKKSQKRTINNENQFQINLMFEIGLIFFIVSSVSLLLILYDNFNLRENLVIIFGISLLSYLFFMTMFYFKPNYFIFKILEICSLVAMIFTLQYIYFFILDSNLKGQSYILTFSFILSLTFIFGLWKKAYKIHSLQRKSK